jgi:hypothetical protein
VAQAAPPGPLRVELWVAGGALLVGLGADETAAGAGPGSAELPPFARELLERPQLLAAWGHGSLLGSEGISLPAELATTELADPARAVMFWLYHLNELGMSIRVQDDGVHAGLRVRTSWANPDEVVAEAEKLIEQLGPGAKDAHARAAALAARFPDSPLARDVEVGGAGLFAPLPAAAALVAASAYARPSRPATRAGHGEAIARLRLLHHDVAEYVKAHGALPAPSSRMTPPEGSCCRQPDHRCAPDAATWDEEPWRSLTFSARLPLSYSLQYELGGDRKSFTLRAAGDPDCDGVPSRLEIEGKLLPDRTVTRFEMDDIAVE